MLSAFKPVPRHGKTPHMRGFTLIELLAVIGITSVLAVLCVGAVQRSINSANKVREINAARILVTALQSTTQDNDGAYLPGMDYRTTTVYKPDGKPVTGHAAQRYPFRLGPYLGDQFDGTIFVNRNKAEILKKTGANSAMYDYTVSTYPALGMNIYCVGGVITVKGEFLNGGDCISRSGNTRGSILAFASGGSGTGSARTSGFNYVTPPTLSSGSPFCNQWQSSSSWTKDKDPMDYGWVDFRYEGKAVCAFLDGSVRMCSVEELKDMRLWTRSALEANDPDYVMTALP